MTDTYPTSSLKSDNDAWKTPALSVAAVFFGLVAIFHETAFNMAKIWWNLETYAHGFLIIPIAGWLIWSKRQHIKQLTPSPEYRGLIFFCGAGFLWLLGAIINAEIIKQIALISMLVTGIWVVLGNKVSHAIMFPMAFLYFMVPAGEDLVPVMMEFTASFTVKLLQISGIPVYREGLFFSIPSGDWSVVKACSGIRYLIASVTLGCVYAYLTYQSLSRRIIFIIASFIVPVIANGLRAYMIVMIGHLSDMKLAVGVDHLIYGWLFFGIVMFVLFAVGSRWRELDEPVVPCDEATACDPASRAPLKKSLNAAAVVLLMAVMWPLFSMGINHYSVVDQVNPLSMPHEKNGWSAEDDPAWSWRPYFIAPDNEMLRFYRKGDALVSVYLGQYLTQNQKSELINTRNVLISKEEKNWRKVDNQKNGVFFNKKKIKLEQIQLRGVSDTLLVWRVYYLDNSYTANRYVVKLLEIKSKLFFSRQDATVMVFATKINQSVNDSSEHAADVLQSFVNAMLPELEQALDHVVGAQ